MNAQFSLLAAAISSRGFIAEEEVDDGLCRLICSSVNTSFWVTLYAGKWVLATWVPTYFEVANEQAMIDLCVDILQNETAIINRVSEDRCVKFSAKAININFEK